MADLEANLDSMHPPKVSPHTSRSPSLSHLAENEANLDSMHDSKVSPHNSPSPPPPAPLNPSENHALASFFFLSQSNPSSLPQVPILSPKPESYVPAQKKQAPIPGKGGSVVMYKIFREAMPESIRLLNLILRLLAVILTLISLSIIATNSHRISTDRNGHSQVGDFSRGSMASSSFETKRKPHFFSPSHSKNTSWIGFSSFSTYKYLLSAGVITCFYSLMQLLSATYCFLTAKSSLLPLPFSYYISFIFDQVCSYLMLSSSSASFSLSQALISSLGALNGISSFTSQANVSASIGFLAFNVVSASSMISGYNVVLHLIS